MNVSTPPTSRQAYTLGEVAKLCGFSYTSIWLQVQEGTFPVTPIRMGRSYRFPKSSIDQLLKLDSQAALATAIADE